MCVHHSKALSTVNKDKLQFNPCDPTPVAVPIVLLHHDAGRARAGTAAPHSLPGRTLLQHWLCPRCHQRRRPPSTLLRRPHSGPHLPTSTYASGSHPLPGRLPVPYSSQCPSRLPAHPLPPGTHRGVWSCLAGSGWTRVKPVGRSKRAAVDRPAAMQPARGLHCHFDDTIEPDIAYWSCLCLCAQHNRRPNASGQCGVPAPAQQQHLLVDRHQLWSNSCV